MKKVTLCQLSPNAAAKNTFSAGYYKPGFVIQAHVPDAGFLL